MGKTYKDFPEFYDNPLIKQIAANKRWTVATNEKKPIDMFCFRYQNRICGAAFTDESSLVDLQTLCDLIPNATNNTYHMDAVTDRFVVLDIEPKCPQDIKQQLLNLPYVYAETSMSGNGYHLLFPLPDCFDDYPVLLKKVVMKEEHGWYEILLNHYITFTRNMIADATGTASFEDVFILLAKEQTETVKANIDVQKIMPDNIAHQETILRLLNDVKYAKTIDDFSGDASRFEYGFIGNLYFSLKRITNTFLELYNCTYTDSEKAWLLYTIAHEKLTYRLKHDETRENLPWVLYLAREIIAKDSSVASKKSAKKKINAKNHVQP